MVALGIGKMILPDVFSMVEGDPTMLAGSGLSVIFLRLGIAKSGIGK